MWPFRRHAAHDIRSSQPYWLQRDGTGDAARALQSSLDCDIAIIGAGITGALVADALITTGLRIVMLDRHEPAQGSTAASTALLQYEIDVHLVDLMKSLGAERATRVYRAGVQAFPMLERRFPELLSLADYQRRESVYLASDASAVPALQAEAAARRAIGIHAEWIDSEELRRRHGCQRPGAIVSPLSATFNPLCFTRAVLSGCARHGVEIYARSTVDAIEPAGEQLRLHVGGVSVTARWVVVAAGYESAKFLGRKVADIDNTFALVTEPLPDRQRTRAMPQFWESARPYLYLRGTRDGRVMMGGADLPFKNVIARDLLLPRQVRKLAAAYEDLFGAELPPIAWAWAGSFANTQDGLPFIGRVPGEPARLLHALCFGGNGITYGVHAGDMIRATVEGRAHALDDLFGFQRLELPVDRVERSAAAADGARPGS
jgi:glycine/D-amino acid oxidase-like deaminating enzyme